MKFIMFINVKMPTIVGILIFISCINTTCESFKVREVFIFHHFSFMISWKTCSVQLSMKKVIEPRRLVACVIFTKIS